MRRDCFFRAILFLAAACVFAGHAGAQTMAEYSAEARLQLDLHVPDAALGCPSASRLVPQRGHTRAGERCESARCFYRPHDDQWTRTGSRWVATGSNRLAYLVAPVKDPAGASVQLVIGGITEDPADAPGPFGVYLPATTHVMRRSFSSGGGSGGNGSGAGRCLNRRTGCSRRPRESGSNCISNSKRGPGAKAIPRM